MYSEEELQFGLTTKVFGRQLYVYDSIDSTNACAKIYANKGAQEGTVVITDHQTAGRGRFGKIWQAESGSSLLFSVVIRPSFSRDRIGLLSFFAAAGVAMTVETITGKQCECKWPNDILLNGRKFCGILMESTFQKNALEYIIIGIGVNVNQRNFPGELAGTATSLGMECGKELDRRIVFCSILSSLELLYRDVRTGNFDTVLAEWKARTTIFGKRVTLVQDTHTIDGIAIDLAADGGFIVETNSGRHVFYAGDVSLAKQY